MGEIANLVDILVANNEIVLTVALLLGIVLGRQSVQQKIPGLARLAGLIGAVSFPALGRLTISGFFIIGGSVFYILTIGGVAELSRVVAMGIGISAIIAALGNKVDLFIGLPG